MNRSTTMFLMNQILPTKFVSECLVKPKFDEIIYELTKQPYFLTPLDLLMLFKYPIQKGLLFSTLNTSNNDATTDVVSHLFEKLKHSLSHALVHFYPLSGRLKTEKYPEENACTISIDCTEGGLGARLIRAAALGLTVSDILSPTDVTADVVSSFFDLGENWNNYYGHTRALLSIQVTELLDAVFIGFSMNHCVGDGTTFIHFINMLSEIFNFDSDLASVKEVIQISRPPIFNYKPWNVNKPDNEDVMVIKFPYLNFDQYLDGDNNYESERLIEKIFHFSSTSLERLKAEANQQCGTTHNNIISSFQALIALVWRSITKARKLPLDQPTICIIPVNARPRLNPPISDDYVGNFISGAHGACKVDQLLGHDLGWAAMSLNKSITAQNEEQILGFFKRVIDDPKVTAPSKGVDPLRGNKVSIGGSSRFDMYGPQFGLGRALAARVGFGKGEDGRVNTNPGCEGEGSIDLEICLKPEVMAALEANEEFMCYVTST
ncbi:protein ENHANCED PSEUDOMONAS SUSCEPTIBILTY 1-like [Chenopodium quinoa]|uniref:protein ENHANCED PSEUDOMONAS SUSCEPTIBILTY 1-like n=1 Tax=Chenopodium quinoa TaxID=63459 RepID=UPI000B7827F3|nr:protein ENHANCED PSEUDOMONAS SUSCEPTIBILTY 1-like [Chenopodium quinoa]